MPRINVPTPIRFICQEGCSNCCKVSGGFVLIRDIDLKRIPKYLKISEAEFIKKYTKEDGKHVHLIDKNDTDCVFLEDNKCTIYPVRPLQCRTFPFWPQNLKTEKRWHIIEEECPGIGEGKEYSRIEIEGIFKGKSVNSEK